MRSMTETIAVFRDDEDKNILSKFFNRPIEAGKFFAYFPIQMNSKSLLKLMQNKGVAWWASLDS